MKEAVLTKEASLPINIVHEVDQNDQGHDQHIDAPAQLLLNYRLFLCQLRRLDDLLMGRLPLLTHDIAVGNHIFIRHVAVDVLNRQSPKNYGPQWDAEQEQKASQITTSETSRAIYTILRKMSEPTYPECFTSRKHHARNA